MFSKMNNQRSKGKNRRMSNLDDSSGQDSSDKDEELDSNSDDDSQGDSASGESAESTDSESLDSSNLKPLKRLRASKSAAVLSDSSESGDENSDKCAICLRSIVSQEVGNPEVCDHLFCSVCIIEWSKNSNVCPLDRQQFSIILVRANKNGNVVKKVPVEEPQAPRIENLELMSMDDTVCEICGSGDREDIMLLCDNCDRGFHTICLTPPLENIPDENEWFCPNCEDSFRGPDGSTAITASGLDDFLENVSTRFRTFRPRVQLVRTRLLERVRVTINRIVENYVLRHSDDPTDDEYLSDDSEDSLFSLESSLDHVLSDQPSTSGTQSLRSTEPKSEDSIKKTKSATTPNKKTRKTVTRRKRKVGTRRKKTITAKRKTSGTTKRKTSKRKVRVKTTRTKKVKVENPDGTITEKIIKTRTYKRRRQKRRKKKLKNAGSGKRGLRVKSITTPKTVKGRLALMLGMMPPKKPGQLLPDVKLKPSNSTSAIDLNRARAGIPKLHIFGPRDELQCFSSESDQEDIVVGGSGGVATVAQQRTNLSRLRDRKKAALALQSMPLSSVPKPKPIVEPSDLNNECVDILGSILDSQAIWHSKHTNTNVKINSDGSIEVIKNKENNGVCKVESNRTIDVRENNVEETTVQAPMYPGASNRAGGFRPNNRNNYGDSRNNQDNILASRGGQGQSGVNFNRFGGPARNDREGYTNYLNNMPQGPTPFCRGGPPLRFRMPPRQQLRRIPFPPRNRPVEQPEETETQTENDPDGKKETTEEPEKETSKKQEDEDVDLYSDIETNVDKIENSGPEDSGSNYPALGPPPEPSAFLLGLDENGDFGGEENKDKSDVYDPAEPCDSEDEMVIDENQERASTPEKKEPESESTTNVTEATLTKENPPLSEDKCGSSKDSSDYDDEEDCPIFSIYSSTTREFSQKEEEERQREIAEDKRKLEVMKSQGEQNLRKMAASNEFLVDVKEKSEDNSVKATTNFKAEEGAEENISDDLVLKKKDNNEEQALGLKDKSLSPSVKSVRNGSRSRSKSSEKDERRSQSVESVKGRKSKSPFSVRDKSSESPESEKYKRTKRKDKKYDTDSECEKHKGHKEKDDAETDNKENEDLEKDGESDNEEFSQKVATGLEGLDVEEVSSDNGDAFADKRSLSSLSLSDLSQRSRRSRSPIQIKKKKKNKKHKGIRSKSGKNYEDGELDDSERDNRLNDSMASSKANQDEVENANGSKSGDKRRGRRSASTGSERQILGSKENKKIGKEKGKEGDLSWKKPSKKEKNYREGKKRSNDRGRSKSTSRRKSKSPSPKKDKKKGKERKKKTEKKKEIERYDVRKIVKNKEIRKTDAFGRDIISKSRSISRSRSRTPFRERSRNMLRRDSRSYSRSLSRSFRRGRSPVRRRYRTRSRSKSIRRSYSRSRSRSRSRRNKKKPKGKDRLKVRSRSRGRKSRSLSRGKRRSLTRSRSRSPIARVVRSKKTRSRKSWSHHVSRTPSFSPRRSRSITRSPMRVRRSSYSRSVSSSWSRGRSPLPTASSLEKLTVVLTTKDKKKWKKKKEGKKGRKDEKRKKKTGNSKEVFASGDNVLVSVNFRNNNSTAGNNSGNNVDSRNTRLNSLSPGPGAETSRKKKRVSDYEGERVTKKSKKSNPISKKVVDVALSNACPKRAKKLTRLSEKDAEVILSRKPVAVIDLDMSPYREQTPSPVNVVVVSDSGSGDEGKEHTPQRSTARTSPNREPEKEQEVTSNQPVKASVQCSPVENGYVPTSGPKTPPEPQIKFSINKPQQLKPIANPLGDDDDDDDEIDEEEPEPVVESLDRRIEKELDPRTEPLHKGPNTPPAPRGPSTPKEPSSPPTSPDAYDPFEPTKSRSPSPSQADKENRLSPKLDGKEDQLSVNMQVENLQTSVISTDANEKASDVVVIDVTEDKSDCVEKSDPTPSVDASSNSILPQASGGSIIDNTLNESPERKVAGVMSTPQNKTTSPAIQKAYAPVLKQVPMVTAVTQAATPTSINVTPTADAFSSLSPTKTNRSTTSTTQSVPITGIQRLQHRLGSPVNRSQNAVRSTPEKRATPRADTNEIFTSGNYMIRNVSKRNGEQTKQPRPLQDATNETIESAMEMEDSPYSPASSEGDDLFDPPVETSKPTQSNSKPAAVPYKGVTRPPPGKSPVKQINKFDLLFGPSLSPLKVPNKKPNTKAGVKPPTTPKALPSKPQKKSTTTTTTKKNLMHKMDEDQLRILDDLPSSAVELQVKDKFLKKLNRQERVVDEVKTVLKPHYARKHITKEEYKDILRRSVPKICHSRSGEINPSKIQSLIEAYVKKFRHAKKKGVPIVAAKPKVKKTMFS